MARALARRQNRWEEVSDSFRATLDETAALLSAFAQGKKADVDEVLADLEALSEMLDRSRSRRKAWEPRAFGGCHHATSVLRSVQEGAVLAAALTDAQAAQGITALFAVQHQPTALPGPEALALLSAAAAAGATLAACGLWIWNAWPEGFVAAQFAAICCSLFATFDRPSKVIAIAVVADHCRLAGRRHL